MTDGERNDVIRMAELALSLLLASHYGFLPATEDLLSPRLSVQNDTQRRGHINALMIRIVVQVLARKITLVTVNEIDLVLLSGYVYIDRWQYIWLFDCSNPWFACHELVTKLGRVHIELVVTVEAVTLFLHFFVRIHMLLFELARKFG